MIRPSRLVVALMTPVSWRAGAPESLPRRLVRLLIWISMVCRLGVVWLKIPEEHQVPWSASRAAGPARLSPLHTQQAWPRLHQATRRFDQDSFPSLLYPPGYAKILPPAPGGLLAVPSAR